MALMVYREYQGEYELVGELSQSGHDQRFSYDSQYLKSPNAQALSFSLPLRTAPFMSSEGCRFFEGMIPEGRVRSELAHRFQVPVSDAVRLLELIGGECVGAVALCPADDKSLLESPLYRSLEEADLDALKRNSVAAMATGMQASRLSLAGAQSKTGWLLPKGVDPQSAGVGDWLVPLGSAPSSHVVKIAGEGQNDLAYNEHVCMEVARACGMSAVRTWVLDALPRVLVSERYDRFWPVAPRTIDGVEAPLRLHQEDFCQMLGWPTYLKYETDPLSCYARICGNLIRNASANVIADVQRFALQVAFDYLVGNCDSHLKNHSMLYSPSWDAMRLAPAYDIVCTTVLGYDHNLGMDIGDHRCIDEVTAEDFELFAGDVGVPVRLFKRSCAELVRSAPKAFETLMASGDDMARVASEIYADAQGRMRLLGEFATA